MWPQRPFWFSTRMPPALPWKTSSCPWACTPMTCARELGWTVHSLCTPKLADVGTLARSHRRADAIVLMTSWRDPADAVIAAVQDLRRLPYQARILFFDYYAPTSSPHWSVLPYVDLYVKRQILRDRNLYQGDLAGGFVFTDFLVRKMGYNLDGWHSGPRPDAQQITQAVPGWNLGVTPRFRRLLRISRLLPGRWRNRPLAVHRRFLPPPSTRPREWYDQYREYALRVSDSLQPRWRCTSGDRVGRKRYLWELMRSKVVLSPFGWGELCFRDYETVACGAAGQALHGAPGNQPRHLSRRRNLRAPQMGPFRSRGKSDVLPRTPRGGRAHRRPRAGRALAVLRTRRVRRRPGADHVPGQPRNPCSSVTRIFSSALFCICRTRSFVTPIILPTCSSVSGPVSGWVSCL